MSQKRTYGYLPEVKVAFGIEPSDGVVFFAACYCNWKDHFNKKLARKILDGRLDKRIELDHRRFVKHAYMVPYDGKATDVLYAAMRATMKLNKVNRFGADRDWEQVDALEKVLDSFELHGQRRVPELLSLKL